jgi:benzodiazapine receptor
MSHDTRNFRMPLAKRDVQEKLFEDAVGADPQMRHRLALYLHDHRTCGRLRWIGTQGVGYRRVLVWRDVRRRIGAVRQAQVSAYQRRHGLRSLAALHSARCFVSAEAIANERTSGSSPFLGPPRKSPPNRSIRVSQLASPVAIASVTVILVLAVGAGSTTVDTWYRDLRKPSWNPPNWVFGPAWTVILALAAWSGLSAWTNTTDDPGRVLILALFGINMVLHMLWSPLFFALKRADWALIEIPFLWLSIAALMLGVGRYSTLSIWLLLPYLLWVTFAAFLNLKIVRLNRPFGERA